MCITTIDGTTIDDAEDLDLVMPMYNLLEYSSNYLTGQVVYAFIPKLKQLILMLVLEIMIVLNLSSIKNGLIAQQIFVGLQDVLRIS